MDNIKIVPYEPCFQPAFKALNEEWITHYGWPVEDADKKIWNNPQENVLDKGGYIFIALHENNPVGTLVMCPLKQNNKEYEMMKFAVSPKVQGKGIGTAIIEAAIFKAHELNVRRLYLESNTRCESAIHLYRKFGFCEVKKQYSKFARCNIQMELLLK